MLGPHDFSSPTFKVEFETTDPVENDRRMLAGLALLRQPGLVSRQTYRETFGKGVFQDNETEETRIMTEAVTDQLIASGVFTQATIQDMQAADQAATLGQAEQAAREQVAEAVPNAMTQTLEQLAGGGQPLPGGEEAAAGFGLGGIQTEGRIV